MLKVQLKTERIDVVGNTVIELDRSHKGYIISIIKQGKIVKKWLISSTLINKYAVAKNWYEYVVNSLQQNQELGISGIPAMIRNSSSSDVQGIVAGLLIRVS